MPSLLAIPTEILQNIIDQCIPDDLPNFAACCREVNNAAKRRLVKHRERIETYSELRYHGCFRHGDDDHPVKILREICLDDHIAFYPRSLNITCCEFPEDVDEPDIDEDLDDEELLAKHLDGELGQAVFEEFESAINDKLSKALCYNDKNISIWRQRLERGNRRAILGLLLLLLPNLEKLYLTNFAFDFDAGESLMKMLDLIARGSHDPDVTFGPVVLTKLSTVFVNGPEEFGGWCQILAPLAVLPSVRTITAKSVFGGHGFDPWFSDLQWPYEQHMSCVTVLNLHSCNLSAASFSQLLGGFKGLKSFSYDCCLEDDYCEDDARLSSIVSILLEHAKASLESVAITGLWDWPCYNGDDSCSFKGFEVLKEIRMQSAYYLKDEQGHGRCECEECLGTWYDDAALVDFLSASVTKVKIDGEVDVTDVVSLLEGLPERKAKAVPHLRSIRFMDYSPRLMEDDELNALTDALCMSCWKVGVGLKL